MFDLAAVAARAGARVAIRAPGVAISYAELAERVDAADARLAARGVTALDRVVLRCTPTVQTIETALALLARRCTVLPIAGDAPAEALRAPLASFAPAWDVQDGDATAHRPPDSPAPALGPGDPPLQALLSSGSTGGPKIVLRSAAQVAAGVRIFATAMGLGADDRVLLLVPLEHSFGFNSVMLGALSSGAEIVLPESRHPRGIVRDVERSGVTFFPAPPLFFDWMQRFAEGRPGRLGNVRACLSVGDILPRATHRAFVETFGVALWQSYGASEAGPALLNRTGVCGDDALALGRPYPEVSVEIRGEGDTALADGEVGELVVRSPAVGLGYLGAHDSASRIADRAFFTGDLGCRRQGEVYFAGRTKILITRAGRKIDPGEIERVLCSHPAVIDAAVCVADRTGHDPLQALVVARGPVAAAELIEHCARALEAYKVPRLIEFRSALPRDGAGKLQRDKLNPR